MDQFANMMSNRTRNINWNSLFKMSDISPAVQSHLTRTYAALALTLLAATFGVGADVYFNIGGTLTLLGVMGLSFAIAFYSDKSKIEQRGAMLLGLGFLQGASIGNLVEYAIRFDPAIVVTALLGTMSVFACFSGAALFAKRRSYLYIGAVLSSITSVLFWTSVMNMLARSTTIYNIQLYAGLFIFCGYVIFDTQMIVEKATYGDRDFIQHALDLFVDFIAIFVRLLSILLQNADKEKDKKRRRRA